MSDPTSCSATTSGSASEPKDPASGSANTSLPSVQEQEKTDYTAGNPDGAGCSDQAEPSEELVQQSLSMFTVGKRHYIVGEIPKAVEVLQQTCEDLSALFGEKARQVAEPYFYYGKALLELVRMECDVLGNALQGVDTENKGEEKEGGEESMIEKDEMTEGAGSSAQDTEEGAKAEGEDTTDDEEGEDVGEEKEEEVSNIQVAWEVLELARIIFAESSDKDSRLRVGDVHSTLGDLGMENSAFNQAIDDFEKCLAVRKELLDADHRHIAETHFQLGLAYSFINDYKPAIEHTEAAAKVLKTKIENVSNSEDKEAAEKEVGSLQEVLKDVEMKILDLRDEMKAAALAEMMTKVAESNGAFGAPGGSGSGFGAPGGSSSGFGAAGGSGSSFGAAGGSGVSSGAGGSSTAEAAPVQMIGARKKAKKEEGEATKAEPAANDISSMIRKKRKPEESENSEELSQKKAKAETNGGVGVLTEAQEPKKAMEEPTPAEEGTA